MFFFPINRPETLWLQRVLDDLAYLHDAGAIDDRYVRQAWLTLHLVAVGDDPLLAGADWEQQEVLRWLKRRSGLTEDEHGGVTVEDVFDGDAATEPFEGRAGRRRNRGYDEPPFIEFIPGYAIRGRKWKFNPLDPDANRVAPHGHDEEDRRVVFDPYKGEVTDENGNTTKVKPKELRELWDDPDFRACAAKARKHMADTQPWRKDAIPQLPEGIVLPEP